MERTYLQSSRQSGRISLLLTVTLMMGVTLIGMSFLYYLRFSQWPMQASINRWSQSLGIVAHEVKKTAEMVSSTTSSNASNSNESGSFGEGIRKCKIKGKVVYSNTECLDTNSTTQTVKLHDSRADSVPMGAAKALPSEDNLGTSMHDKMIDRAIEKATK